MLRAHVVDARELEFALQFIGPHLKRLSLRISGGLPTAAGRSTWRVVDELLLGSIKLYLNRSHASGLIFRLSGGRRAAKRAQEGLESESWRLGLVTSGDEIAAVVSIGLAENCDMLLGGCLQPEIIDGIGDYVSTTSAHKADDRTRAHHKVLRQRSPGDA